MKIALSFSGGGLRAAAHAGVVRFLEEQGIGISAVSGSSAGAMVALMLAGGKSSGDIYRFVKDLETLDLFKMSSNPGLFSLDNLEKKLQEEVGISTYDETQMPLYTCVTDINTGESLYLNSGDPVANTIASSSLTPTYEAKEIAGKFYVDGSFKSLLIRSIHIMLHSNIRASKKITDVYLRIEGVADIHLFNFKEIDRAYESGYREIKAKWGEIREKLL